jgi:putative endopeptidase
MKPTLRAAVSAVALLSASLALAQATGPTKYGAWGIDLSARDSSVKPGDEFYDYALGAWYAKTEIPADQASTGVGRDAYNLTQEQLKSIIETSAKSGATPTARQVGGLYASFMDEALAEKLDDKPLKPLLAEIAAIKDKAAFTRYMGRTARDFGISVAGAQPYADAKSPVTALYLGQGGLGLPDRDYYLSDQFKEKKDRYRAYIETTLRLIGYGDPAKTADAIMAFEMRIAEASWPAADSRDVEKIYNPMTIAELQAYAPGLDWKTLQDGAGLQGVDKLIVLQNTAIQKIAKIYDETPLETLKAWQALHVTSAASPYLSNRFVDNQFAFFGKGLQGTPSLRARWKRGVELVDGSLGEAVGQEYVAAYFPATSKAKMEALVANLKVAMAARIKKLSWMSDTTKASAQQKLAKMEVMVGYPDKWRDYSGLKIDPKDLVGNVRRAIAFEADFQFGKVGKPVDRTDWGMTPQTVNAYNGGFENKIVFPAGILQPPFFDPNADPAVNYGAIGAIIGHEITHGFDDQGRKIDAEGRLRDWWTPEDAKRFTVEATKLVNQYNSYQGVPGMSINGMLTLGENIADVGGLVVAFDAYQASLGGKPAPVIDGLSGEQRFFMAFAQAWRGKSREDALKAQMASDPHSPRRFRVLGPTRNADPWYAAFGVKAGDKYYLKPEDRSRVW